MGDIEPMNAALTYITGADTFHAKRAAARSRKAALSLVSEYHRRVTGRARDYVEAFYYFGLAVRHATDAGGYGAESVLEIHRETGINRELLYTARGFADIWGDDLGALYEWVSSWIAAHEVLLKGDIKAFVKLNRGRGAAEIQNPDSSSTKKKRSLKERRMIIAMQKVRRAIKAVDDRGLTSQAVEDIVLPISGRVVRVLIENA